MENVRKIGEKWGPVLCIDNKVGSLCSLTYAHLLVRSKAQNKIDARIRLLFDHGSCDVWVKEGCCDKGKLRIGSHGPNGTYEGSAEGEAVSSFMANSMANVVEISIENRKIGCTEIIDPMLSDMVCRLERENEQTWYDPIVVNETARWLMVMSEGNRESYPQPHEEPVRLCENITTLNSQSKNPRGRPKR